ncbi:MAG: enoyl-CoA hydratase-related protein [Gammaproteobacteria bacterium]
MTADPVLVDISEGVMTLTLNQPDRLNAMNPVLRYAIIAAMDRADADDAVRAVIVTGAGRGFCAGADISKGASGFVPEQASGPWRDGGGMLSLRFFESKKPVIGAINGAAIGVGVACTLPMDFRLASTTAKFGFPYTQRGIGPEGCSSWFLPRLVGVDRALDWILTGRIFGAEEALQAGLVRSLHAPGELLPEARRIAWQIASQTAPVASSVSRRMIWRMLAADHPVVAHRAETRVVPLLAAHRDAKEGVAAFLDKRPANFTGSVSADLPPDLDLGPPSPPVF